MFKTRLIEIIKEALAELGLGEVAFSVEHPTVAEHGDFATNAAMVAAKAVGKNPRALADELVAAIMVKQVPEIASVSVAGPGFINFKIADAIFRKEVARIAVEGTEYGKVHTWDGKRILVEHSSPNLFKPFHIGHLMNNAVGESIVRLAKFSGAGVTAISYPSDVSLGIAKAVWSLINNNGPVPELLGEVTGTHVLDTATLHQHLDVIAAHYVYGSKYFESGDAFISAEKVQEQVREVSSEIFDYLSSGSDTSKKTRAVEVYESCKDLSLQYFNEVIKRLNSHFDAYIFESETGKVGEKIVQEHVGDVFTKSEGAIIFEGEKDGLHTRVFINRAGQPTYEAKDIGLSSLKFSRYAPDLSLFVTDHEQQPVFEVVETAISKFAPDWASKTVHRTHGRMTFKGQKLSSRLGGVPLASDIIDTLVAEVAERAPALAKEDAEKVAIGAIKFAILRAAAGKNINFDPDTSLSFEGDSGPYLQYTCVRARSVLRKAAGEGHMPDSTATVDVPVNAVEKALSRFPEVVTLAVAEWAPHHVAGYLLELAQAYNSWYGNTKIIDVENPAMPYNLALTRAVADVVSRGLDLLGIAVPASM